MSNIPLTHSVGNATSNLQKQKVELVQNEIKALGQSGLSDAEKAKKLREQCEGFESIFIQKMWQQMRATLPQENPLVGREEKFWQSMYDQELSKKMSEGGGIGLADMMYEQLSQNLASVSRTTAGNMQHSSGGFALDNKQGANAQGFSIQPATFIPSPLANLDKQSEQGSKEGGMQSNAKVQNDLLADNKAVESIYADASLHVNAPLYEEIAGGTMQALPQNSPQNYFVVPGQAGQMVQAQLPQQQQVQAQAPQASANNGNIQMHRQIISGNGSNDNRALQAFLSNAQQNPQAVPQAQAQVHNGTMLQQYLVGLQQKEQTQQVQQGQHMPQNAVHMTGPERAQQAQRVANTQAPLHGVLPPVNPALQSQGAQSPVVRTTYTTNIPKNQRNGDTERLVRQALTQNNQQNAMTQQQAQHMVQPLVYPAAQVPQSAQALQSQLAQAPQATHNTGVIPHANHAQAQPLNAQTQQENIQAYNMEPPVAQPYINPSAAPTPQPVNGGQGQDVGLGVHFVPPHGTAPVQVMQQMPTKEKI